LAVSYSALGRFDDARKALQSAITTHPSYATAHENLGNIYAMMAADAYNHALSLDEKNTAARDKLALMSELFSVGTINSTPRQPSKQTTPPPAPQPTVVASAPVPAPAPVAAAVEAAAPAIEEEDAELAMMMEEEDDEADSTASEFEQGILSTARQWAQAWSNKDAAGYLNHYHSNFKPKRGLSRSSWEKQRKQRIAKPRFIEIEVLDPEITAIGEDEAKIVFLQTYRSNTYSDETRKYLQMKRDSDGWKIVREVSLQ